MKVLFNIKKLQLSPITAMSDAGIPTYGNALKVPGTVSLTMDAEDNSEPFYADGGVYYKANGADTLTGALENARFGREVLKEIFAYIEDSNKNMISTAGPVKDFGMQFAVDSDEGEVFFTYYNVNATKPGENFTTNAPGATINPQSVNLTASAIAMADGTKVTHGYAVKGDANYDNYFESITIPTVASV